MLFAPIGGLFFVTPAMWLPVFGIWPGLKRQPWLIGGALITASMEIYISSCPLIWDGGSTFGARLLTPLTPFFVLLSALAIASAHRWFVAKPSRALVALGLAISLPLAFMMIGLVASIHRRQPLSGFTQEGTYGGGVAAAWSGLDQGIGDLSLLPAELLFHWRYGLPVQSFRQATYSRTFLRDYKTMHLSADVIHFAEPAVLPVLRGFTPAPGGATIVGRQGAVVFAANWPFATRLSVAARASRPTRLKVGLGRFYGARWIGESNLAGTVPPSWPSFTLPKGSFDSGLNEVVFECDPSPCAGVVVEAIRLHDDGVYPPPFH